MLFRAFAVLLLYLPGTTTVSTSCRQYDVRKGARAVVDKMNRVHLPHQGKLPMNCLVKCGALEECQAINAFTNGSCDILVSPVTAVVTETDCTAYILHDMGPVSPTTDPVGTTKVVAPTTDPVGTTKVLAPTSDPVGTTKVLAPTSDPVGTTKVLAPTLDPIPPIIVLACPPGFGYPSAAGGHSSCYHFSSEKYTWRTGRTYCQNLGGDLASIESQDEKAHINSVKNSNASLPGAFWGSGTDVNMEGTWKWIGTDADVSDAVIGDGPNQDCLWLMVDGTSMTKFYAFDCGMSGKVLCEAGTV